MAIIIPFCSSAGRHPTIGIGIPILLLVLIYIIAAFCYYGIHVLLLFIAYYARVLIGKGRVW